MYLLIWLFSITSLVTISCIREAQGKSIDRTTKNDHQAGPGNGRLITTSKTDELQKKEFWKVSSNVHWLDCTSRKQGKLRYDVENGRLVICYDTKWRQIGWTTKTPEKGKLPLSCLDAKLKGLGEMRGNGLYWINPTGINDLRNSLLVYCDMTTAGGGWTLAAKITHDYAWICPEKKGFNCLNSSVDPLRANLFHSFHARDFLDLSIRTDQDSGVHLKNSNIRKIFDSGHQSVRFSFVMSSKGWEPSEDAYAVFNKNKINKMFLDDTWVDYSRENNDYTWNVLRHDRRNLQFTGSTICWGKGRFDYRFYDHGLQVGTPSRGLKRCHMAYDENEVMLKSHYAKIDNTGRKAYWDKAQFGYLRSNILQAPCKRIALWVR